MGQLERFLPPSLRFSDTQRPSADQHIGEAVQIIDRARRFGENDLDVLEYMLVRYGRDHAILHLIDELLKDVSTRLRPTDELPSNIHWPASLLNGELHQKFEVDAPVQSVCRYSNLEERYRDHTNEDSVYTSSTMRQIWLSLGRMIITAAKLGGPKSQHIMSTVYRALAKIHHYNLVPETVYTYQPTPYSSTVNRPPILHLLSSRILTTLSDAVWRSQQEEVITRAAEKGTPLESLSRDPPGGRFRLKVLDLGPEVWLEFVLWCCVEGRYASTGAKIISQLNKDVDQPWYAVNWTSNDVGRSVPLVDWSRANARTGGTVGRIEGYSKEQPLANIPSRTISAEVVLALAEGLVTASDIGHLLKPMLLERCAKNIQSLISFLEPHSLPAEYFDYLSVRLLQTEKIDIEGTPKMLDMWSQVMEEMRNLESVTPRAEAKISLDYEAIVNQSRLNAGLTHQVLTAYIHNDLYLQSIDVFSKLQYQIDKVKLQSIIAFVHGPRNADAGFFDVRSVAARQEYADSHGELPSYKMAALLQHMTSNAQLHIAEWMVYSDDVDGPSIPRNTFGQLSTAAALVRLAPETKDDFILDSIAEEGRKWRFKPAVKLLRSLVDAHIIRLDFSRAMLVLEQLQNSIAGGYSPNNLASLAATILRLEEALASSKHGQLNAALNEALSLMQQMLNGTYNGTKGDFYQSQVRIFRHQVRHLLRVFEALPGSNLVSIARRFKDKYAFTNAPNLVPGVFNTLLSGIVDARGAQEGRRIWQIFCRDPRVLANVDIGQQELELFLNEVAARSDDDFQDDYEMQVAGTLEDEEEETGVYGVTLRDDEGTGDHIETYPGDDEADVFEAFNSGPNPPHSDISFSADFETNISAAPTSVLEVEDSGTRPRADLQQPSSPQTMQHVGDNPADRNPVVIPCISTMRIIVRRALLERDSSHSRDIIVWAAPYMRRMGLSMQDFARETSIGLPGSLTGGRELAMRQQIDNTEGTPLPEQPPVPIRRHFVSGSDWIHGQRQLLWGNLLRDHRS
ncbi:uncharacterized protein HMPREF1541_00882 [Cyphellophora europaea CBS 101466]|uniref:Uncharacterized protein n=1 Tax=Cyphellophora europaea (strain CBS 101466) TaxID=1220924 RepID=W2SDJ3_CYPE1|nr:uncharacterized protein HMPREF1541_00882 [Cyphellophora europaea CBS 101466]ETN46695.1 hypothetical protein HMPREF1541_00882 [Cyphellophora europaea CBS 101466]